MGVARATASNEQTAADMATDYLRRRILAGEVAPGTAISQNEVAAALGVSRSPVRDAITALAAERLVMTKARASAVVAPLSLDDLQELYELRMAIEPSLSRLALPNLNRVTLLHMEEQLEVMEATDDMATWIETNDRFHADLYRQAPRPRMVEIVDRARQQTGRYTRLLITEVGAESSNLQHRRIHDAAARRDGPLLEAELFEHLSSACDLILRLMYERIEAAPQEVTT